MKDKSIRRRKLTAEERDRQIKYLAELLIDGFLTMEAQRRGIEKEELFITFEGEENAKKKNYPSSK